MGHKITEKEAALTIWEVDDDNDGSIDWDEFKTMFYRVRDDESGCEPRKLFNVVDFLMLDKNHSGSVDMDECVTLLYARYGKEEVEVNLKQMKSENHKSVRGCTLGASVAQAAPATPEAARNAIARSAQVSCSLRAVAPSQLMADAANEKNVNFSFFTEIHRRCKKKLIGTGIKAGATTVPQVNGLKFVSDPQFQHLM